MPRPKGLGTESRADLFFLCSSIAAFVFCVVVALSLALVKEAKAEGGVMIITQCKTLEEVREVSKRNWDTQTVYADTQAQAIMKVFNSIPPRTDLRAHRVMLANRATQVGLMRYGIVLEVDDCVENYYRLRPDVYRQLIEAVEGKPI